MVFTTLAHGNALSSGVISLPCAHFVKTLLTLLCATVARAVCSCSEADYCLLLVVTKNSCSPIGWLGLGMGGCALGQVWQHKTFQSRNPKQKCASQPRRQHTCSDCRDTCTFVGYSLSEIEKCKKKHKKFLP